MSINKEFQEQMEKDEKENKITKEKRNSIILKRAIKSQYGTCHSDHIKEILTNYIYSNNPIESDDDFLNLIYLISSGSIKKDELFWDKEATLKKIKMVI